MHLLNNSATRREKYANFIHKTNLQTFGFVVMCTHYILLEMCAVLTDVFFQAGELIYVKLNSQRTAKLITSSLCYLPIPELTSIFQKLK